MTRTRLTILGALLVLLIGTVAGGAVSARPQEGIKVTPEEKAEKDYGAMGPGCPACSDRTGAANTLPTSSQCGGNYVWCDAIPVEIVPPTGLADDRDNFFTIFELHWDGSNGNDLDLKFYDNAQSTGSNEQLGASQSTKNPEIIRAANTDLTEYFLVVINYSGANTGYKIKARISTDPFTSPNEALAPEPPKQAEPPAEKEEKKEEAEEEFATPEDFSGGSGSPIGPDPTLDSVGGAGDSDFGFGFSDLDSRITVEQDDFAAGGPAAPSTPAENVSAAVLLASLVGAPALIAGSGAAFVWKRRRDLLI